MTFWSGFNQYVGVQGLAMLALVGGFIFAEITGVELSQLYQALMTTVTGFYFAKNGVGIVAAIRGNGSV